VALSPSRRWDLTGKGVAGSALHKLSIVTRERIGAKGLSKVVSRFYNLFGLPRNPEALEFIK
jgi:hypothetical protein